MYSPGPCRSPQRGRRGGRLPPGSSHTSGSNGQSATKAMHRISVTVRLTIGEFHVLIYI